MTNFDRIINPVKHFLMEGITDPLVYLQLATVAGIILLAKYLSYLTKKYINKVYKESRSQYSLSALFLQLTTPLYSSVLLALASGLLMQITHSNYIVVAVAKLTLVWLVLRTIFSFSHHPILARFFGAITLVVAALSITNLLDPTIKYFDSLVFSVGNFRISFYLILKAIVSLVFILLATTVVLREGRKYIRKVNALEYNIREVLVKVFEVFLYGIVFLIMLNIIGIDLTALAVFSGAVGVGIGFGLQKIAANFISGIVLLLGKSVRVGDIIELDGTSVLGQVKNMGAGNMIVETFDGKEILVPNENIIANRVTNWTYSNTRGRIDIAVGISYESDIRKAMQLMLAAAKAHASVIEVPEKPSCFVREFADSAINLVLYFWISNITEGRARIKSDVMLDIWDKFAANEIEIPYPQREVKIKNLDELKKVV